MKPAFVSCRQKGLAQEPADLATLQGRFRLRIRIDASGKVGSTDLPQYNPRRPIYDEVAAGSPTPNPDNPHLREVVVPCIEARLRQSSFGVAEHYWAIILDVQVH